MGSNKFASACRARAIKDCVGSLREHAVAASLQQSVDLIESGDAVAGNFLRFARRTMLQEPDESQAVSETELQMAVPSPHGSS
jgi:hypothetical protein